MYDRSGLILRSVETLKSRLAEEFLVVALVCVLFLWHLRSALVAIVTLPLGVLVAFGVMHQQGINANIMSLGGIAIAIGAMVDAAVVMIGNAHKKLELWRNANGTAVQEVVSGAIGGESIGETVEGLEQYQPDRQAAREAALRRHHVLLDRDRPCNISGRVIGLGLLTVLI